MASGTHTSRQDASTAAAPNVDTARSSEVVSEAAPAMTTSRAFQRSLPQLEIEPAPGTAAAAVASSVRAARTAAKANARNDSRAPKPALRPSFRDGPAATTSRQSSATTSRQNSATLSRQNSATNTRQNSAKLL
eukprot:579148-Pleurochrysis_carterae.AAC.1